MKRDYGKARCGKAELVVPVAVERIEKRKEWPPLIVSDERVEMVRWNAGPTIKGASDARPRRREPPWIQ
jgi:hypothetical protein